VRRADRREPALDRRDRMRASAKLAVRPRLGDDERGHELRRHRQLVSLAAAAQVGAQRLQVGAVGTLRRGRAAVAGQSPRGRQLARELGVLILRQAGPSSTSDSGDLTPRQTHHNPNHRPHHPAT
jgi:CHASE2 domain-containing sensor protein